MSVTNIECQIARNQIGRYLAGDGFSTEAVRQLESHIAECAGCKGFLSERKAALQAMLGGPSPKAAIEVSDEMLAKVAAARAAKAAAPAAAAAPAPTPK